MFYCGKITQLVVEDEVGDSGSIITDSYGNIMF